MGLSGYPAKRISPWSGTATTPSTTSTPWRRCAWRAHSPSVAPIPPTTRLPSRRTPSGSPRRRVTTSTATAAVMAPGAGAGGDDLQLTEGVLASKSLRVGPSGMPLSNIGGIIAPSPTEAARPPRDNQHVASSSLPRSRIKEERRLTPERPGPPAAAGPPSARAARLPMPSRLRRGCGRSRRTA